MADKNLGAWNEDSEKLALTPLSGRGSDADAPNAVRFARSVMQLVLRRELQPDCEFERPAAFVLAPRDWRRPDGTVRRPLLHTGQTPLTGQLHFVNVVANGHSLAFDGGDAELMDALCACKAGDLPTLVYSPKQGSSTLTWYPSGTNADETLDLWEVTDAAPTVKDIFEIIGRVHKGELITPDQTIRSLQLWEDASKGWARRDAEARVQHSVKIALLAAFRTCSVRGEQSGKDGRTDLEIVEDQNRLPNQVEHHAILELKVLREKGEEGNGYTPKMIAEHMRDGLMQANHYGRERNFRDRLLCCFDMRAKNIGRDAAFADIASDANTLGVELGYWFIYRSSDHWRDCDTTKALSA